MSASLGARRGGAPWTTQPMAGPWLSPQVVNRKIVPKLLPATPILSAVSDDRDVGRVDRLHADDVITAIDVMNLAADAGRKTAEEINPGAADILDCDVALQRRVVLVPFEDVAKVADSRGGKRLDRPG